MLLRSWATPPANRPTASIFCACRTCCSASIRWVMSRPTPTMPATSPPRAAQRRERGLHVPRAAARLPGPLVGHRLARERAEVGALVDGGALPAHDLGGAPAQEVCRLEALALEPAAEDVDAALVAIQPEDDVVDRLDQGPEALLGRLDGRERRGALRQQHLVRGEGRGALERGRQESGDQADGVRVEVVEGVRPGGPHGHDGLHPVLPVRAARRWPSARPGPRWRRVGPRLEREIVAADQLARCDSTRPTRRRRRDGRPIRSRPEPLASHSTSAVVFGHEHAGRRRPG